MIEAFFGFNPRGEYDFVGTEDRMAEVAAELSGRLDVTIVPE